MGKLRKIMKGFQYIYIFTIYKNINTNILSIIFFVFINIEYAW